MHLTYLLNYKEIFIWLHLTMGVCSDVIQYVCTGLGSVIGQKLQ